MTLDCHHFAATTERMGSGQRSPLAVKALRCMADEGTPDAQIGLPKLKLTHCYLIDQSQHHKVRDDLALSAS